MAIDIMLLDGAAVLRLRPLGSFERGDVARIGDLLAMVETAPGGLLLDWSEFAKGSVDAMTEASELGEAWQPRRVAVLAPEAFEDRISLLIRRKAGAAEVRRFELNEEDAARAWLIAA